MLNEAWQRGPTQSRFTLPPLVIAAGAKGILPAEGKTQTNCGEISHEQMIPLEDFRVGWGNGHRVVAEQRQTRRGGAGDLRRGRSDLVRAVAVEA